MTAEAAGALSCPAEPGDDLAVTDDQIQRSTGIAAKGAAGGLQRKLQSDQVVTEDHNDLFVRLQTPPTLSMRAN